MLRLLFFPSDTIVMYVLQFSDNILSLSSELNFLDHQIPNKSYYCCNLYNRNAR